MARKTKPKHRLVRGHLAVGLGLLSGACGADTQIGERKIDVPTAPSVENLIQGLQNLLFVPSPLRHSYQGDAGP